MKPEYDIAVKAAPDALQLTANAIRQARWRAAHRSKQEAKP
jgi:hypothetical protein